MESIPVCFYRFREGPDSSMISSAISRDGCLVAGGYNDSTVRVWAMPEDEQNPPFPDGVGIFYLQGEIKPFTLLQGHTRPVHATTFSPLGDLMVSASADSIRLRNTKQWNADPMNYNVPDHPSTVWDVKVSPRRRQFASASDDNRATLWSIEQVTEPLLVMDHSSAVRCVQWHPLADCIATGSSDGTVRLWDASTGDCTKELTGHTSEVLSLAVSTNVVYMASGDQFGAIRIWDIRMGQCTTPLLEHSSSVSALGFSRDGSVLASGSTDSRIKLWDVNTSVAPQPEAENVGTNSPNSRKTLRIRSPLVRTLQFSSRNSLLFAAGPHGQR